MRSSPLANGSKTESTTSNTCPTSKPLALMWPVSVKCSTKSWWSAKHVSQAFAPSVKNFFHSVSTKSLDKWRWVSRSGACFCSEWEMRFVWLLLLIRHFISRLSLLLCASSCRLSMERLISTNRLLISSRNELIKTIRLLSWKLRLKLFVQEWKCVKMLKLSVEKKSLSVWKSKKHTWSSSLRNWDKQNNSD